MKVGDGQKSQRSEAPEQRSDKKEKTGRGKDQRSFSDLMERRGDGRKTSSVKDRATGSWGGDERSKELQEGTVQQRDRDQDGQRLVRTDRKRSDDQRVTPEADRGKEKGSVRGEGQRDEKLTQTTREGTESGASSVRGDEETVPQELREVREVTGQSAEAKATEQTGSSLQSEATAEVARQIVNAVHVGEDAQMRRVVFLDVTVPGKGDVRVRLRRDGSGMQVRMRADNDALARELQQGVGGLREEGAKKGIQFTSIQVVR